MIPHLSAVLPPRSDTQRFLLALNESGFKGEVSVDLARRLVGATDNSVYQLLPEAIIYPRGPQDITLALELLERPAFHRVQLTPRGGGTGTNGQSLTTGISLDLSRHMSEVIELNLEEGWVRVQAGLVLDRLNERLRPHGVFFAPNLSPSNRATIGGMINTDAAGKGSRVYGKTSDHILELKLTVIGGPSIEIAPIEEASSRFLGEADLEPERQAEDDPWLDRCAQALIKLAQRDANLIEETFPKLNRFMTGYNLKMLYNAEHDRLDLCRLIAGSEGTLGVVTEAKLKLTPLPRAKRVILLRYSRFEDALGSAQLLLAQGPSAIETIDETILSLARNDVIYHRVKAALEGAGEGVVVSDDRQERDLSPPIRAINLLEFEGMSEAEVEAKVERCLIELRPHYGAPDAPIGAYVAHTDAEQESLWALRKKGVGLLAARPGRRKPVAFVEDTVVPPEHLKEYINAFTELLDAEGVEYGLFGHVDVGCLHVRPALDLRDPEDEARFGRISDRVAALVQSYGGLIWGEHGKGIRSAYSPDFFGPLYPTLQEVKSLFDPRNQLNPGKVATPDTSTSLMALRSPLRAHQDREIQEEATHVFSATVNCNGNGQCFDDHPDQVMCPSATVTRDRLHSPKGRAGVMRAWLKALADVGRALSAQELNPFTTPHRERSWLKRSIQGSLSSLLWLTKWRHKLSQKTDFSAQVYEAMSGCLSCKACATHCPVKVDVPQFKARFLNLYYTRYPRPLRDLLIGELERLASWGSRAPRLVNLLTANPISGWVSARGVGLVDPPRLSAPSALHRLRQLGVPPATPERLRALSIEERERALILIPDAFNTFFDAETFVGVYRALKGVGFLPYIAPFSPNGKGLHVKGQLEAFRGCVHHHLDQLTPLAKADPQIPLIAIDPAVALTYRDEYLEALNETSLPFKVWLVQEWLVTVLPRIPRDLLKGHRGDAPSLFAHCTERTAHMESTDEWRSIFDHLGVKLEVPSLGCCGMCGAYGHEREHSADSRALFEMSWAKRLDEAHLLRRTPLVTGYSCRSQIKRCNAELKDHPLTWIASALEQARSKDIH